MLDQKKLEEGNFGKKVVGWGMRNLRSNEGQEDSLVVPYFKRNH
jgi:hypothetical protein